MLVPEGSKVKQQRREMKLLGQAGKFDPKGAFIEGSAVYDWEIQLYDEESEIEYQESLNTAFKGKGLTRPVGKWNEIRRFDLPAFLSNYPGGKQSMFRLDHKNAEGKYVARIVLYCNDGLLKTDQNQRAARLQIHQMLESIKLHP